MGGRFDTNRRGEDKLTKMARDWDGGWGGGGYEARNADSLQELEETVNGLAPEEAELHTLPS